MLVRCFPPDNTHENSYIDKYYIIVIVLNLYIKTSLNIKKALIIKGLKKKIPLTP